LHPFGCREKELSSQADYDCRSTKISNTGKMKVLDTEASPSDDINSSKLDKFKNSGISSIIAINNNNYQGLSAIMSLVKVIRWKRLMGAFLLIRSTPKPSVYKTMIVESLDIDESKYQNKKIELSSPHKRLVLADNSKFAASRLSVKAGDVCLILLDEQQVSDYAKLGARDSWKKSQPESRPKTNGTPAANEAKSPQGSSSNQLQAAASPQNELVEDEPGGAEAAAPSGTAHAHAAGAPLRPN
jgi:hypothetical protein